MKKDGNGKMFKCSTVAKGKAEIGGQRPAQTFNPFEYSLKPHLWKIYLIMFFFLKKLL